MTSYVAELPKTLSNWLSMLFGVTVEVGSHIMTPDGDGIITDVEYNPPMNFAMPVTVRSVRTVIDNQVFNYPGYRLKRLKKGIYMIKENIV